MSPDAKFLLGEIFKRFVIPTILIFTIALIARAVL